MTKNEKSSKDVPRPFPFWGHGFGAYEEVLDICLFFQDALTPGALESLRESFPIEGLFQFRQESERTVWLEIGKGEEYVIREFFDEAFRERLKKEGEKFDWGKEKDFLPTTEQLDRFQDTLDRWLETVQGRHPIAFVFRLTPPAKRPKNPDGRHERAVAGALDHILPLVLESGAFSEDRRLMELVATVIKKSPKNKANAPVIINAVELMCENDGVMPTEKFLLLKDIDDYEKKEEYMQAMFALGGILERVIPKGPEAVPIISALAPYTQMVLFAGEEHCSHLGYFPDPAGHVKGLLARVDPRRNPILSLYMRYALVGLYDQARDEKFINFDPLSLRTLIQMALELPNNFVETEYRRMEEIWKHFGWWEDFFALARNPKWLRACVLTCEDPLWALKDRFKEVPGHKEEKRLCLLDIAETLKSYPGATQERLARLRLSHAVRKLAQAP
jgi:hypothetical protein